MTTQPTTPATTLTAILDALDRAEAVARAASEPDWTGEVPTFYSGEGVHRDDWGLYTFHVDPAAVLRQVAGLRAIVGECTDALEMNTPPHAVNSEVVWLAEATLAAVAQIVGVEG